MTYPRLMSPSSRRQELGGLCSHGIARETIRFFIIPGCGYASFKHGDTMEMFSRQAKLILQHASLPAAFEVDEAPRMEA